MINLKEAEVIGSFQRQIAEGDLPRAVVEETPDRFIEDPVDDGRQ